MSDVYADLDEFNALYAWLPSEEDKAYIISNLEMDVACYGVDMIHDTIPNGGVHVNLTIINKVNYDKAKWWKFWTWLDGHGTQQHKLINERSYEIADNLTRGKDICIYLGNVGAPSGARTAGTSDNWVNKQTLLFCGVITGVTSCLNTTRGAGIEATVSVTATLRNAIVSQGLTMPTFKIDGSYGEVKIRQSVEAPKNVKTDIISNEIDGFMSNKALNVSAIAATILDGTNKPDKYKDGSGSCSLRNLINVDDDDKNTRIELSTNSQAYELGSYLIKYLANDCAGMTPYSAFVKAMQNFYIVPVPNFEKSYSANRKDFSLRPGCEWSNNVGKKLDTGEILGYTMTDASTANATSYYSVAVRYASPRKADASQNVENFALYVGGYDNGKPWMLAGNEVRKKWGGDKFELETGWFHRNKELTNIKVYELPAWVRHTQAWGASADMAGIGTADPPEVYKNQKRWADCVAKQLMASLVRSGVGLYIELRISAALELRNYMGQIIQLQLPRKTEMANKPSKMFTKEQTWYGYLSLLSIRINTTGQNFQVSASAQFAAARNEKDHDVFSIPVTKLYDID